MGEYQTKKPVFVSPMGQKEKGEVYTATQKLIIRLQAIRMAQNLSVPDVEKLVNHEVSKSTLYRFFEEGSESKYNFDTFTIDAIKEALLVVDTMNSGDDVAKEKTAGFEAVIQQMKVQMEEMRTEYERRCQEYETRLALWQDQVRKKDDRMDRKDRLLDQKDEEIQRLRARVDELTDKLLEQKA